MTSLYEITSDMVRLLDALDAADVDSETGEVIGSELALEILDEIEGEYAHKLDACARVVRSLEAEAGAVADEAQRLFLRSSALQKNAERLKECMRRSLVATGTKSLRTQLFTVGLRQGSERVEVTDRSAVPVEFLRVPEVTPQSEWPVNKAEAGKALKSGGTIPGLTLVRGEPTLSVK